MILAMGTDLCDKSRIYAVVERRGEAFAKRILTVNEYERYRVRGDRIDFLARRFAAKEAIAKALGVGIGRGIGWQQMEIMNNTLGAPQIKLLGAARERFDELGAVRAHITMSDEKSHAIAFVVFEN